MDYIKGVDISTLHEIEECGGKYYDHGKQGDLLDILASYDVNYVRLRLWNDPYSADGKPYGAGTNDIAVTTELAKRAIDHKMGFLLDLHYSDFWADPGKQIIPKAWKGYGIEELEKAVYDFTLNTVSVLKGAGCEPTMVQVGNEITNGLLWPYGRKPDDEERARGDFSGFDNMARFISAGIRAVREVNPDIKIMIHLDNGGNNAMYRDWFDHYIERGEDFDIIGLSYYPFWHGDFSGLKNNMDDIAQRYGKDLVVAEVSMGFTMEDYATYENLAPNERKGYATKQELVDKLGYPMTVDGQMAFLRDFFDIIDEVPGKKGKGFFYWEPGWIPVPKSEWATPEALEYTGEKGPGGNEWANQALFDYNGNALKSFELIRDLHAK